MLEERQYMVLDERYVVAIGRGSRRIGRGKRRGSRGTIRIIWVASTPRRLSIQEVRRLLRVMKILGDHPTVTVEAWRPKQNAGWVKDAFLPKMKGRLLVE
jgi:hypothetical protein